MKKLRIINDSFPENPREWDNLGVVAIKHRRCDFGDEKIDDPIDWLCQKLGYDDLHEYNNEKETEHEYNNETLDILESEFYENYIALKLYMYEHGGVTISTSPFSCPWDSGQIGYIYIPQDDEEVRSLSTEKAKTVLRAEVDVLNKYINGDVYGFKVEEVTKCPCCGAVKREEIDSCWGFYGDNFMENGMADQVPDKVLDQLKNYKYEDVEFNY